VDAVCFAGGSSMGLAASVGVLEWLYESHDSNPSRLPSVTGGVIYDFAPPGRTGVYPDAALGRAAAAAAEGGAIPIGSVGAGRSATCGKLGIQGWAESGGQGAASTTIGAVSLVALVVVNALGVVVDRDGTIMRGNRDPATGQREVLTAEQMIHGTQRQRQRFGGTSEATTLTAVVTNARLSRRDLNQLARQVHASLARAIHPLHAMGDGDTLWFLTTDAVIDESLVPTALGAAAAELAWDAVLTSFDD
jgi:L-aminopeptidase/D-esterase-like protein